MDYFIKIYENAIPDNLCDELVNYYNSNNSARFDLDWRKCGCISLYTDNILYNSIVNYIKQYYDKYRNDITNDGGASTTYGISKLELPNIFKYIYNSDNPEFFSCHADAWNFDSSSRQISIIIYLSDVEEGGETYFPLYKINVKPKKGRLLIFPSSFCFMHEGCKVIKGEKYIMVSRLHFNGQTHYLSNPF